MLKSAPQHPLHNLSGDPNIDAFTGQVEKVTAHHTQGEIHDHNDHQPNRQGPQGLNRMIGHHSVVYIHGEQGQRQCKQIDKERGN